jgi:type VI secretion system protein ImpL
MNFRPKSVPMSRNLFGKVTFRAFVIAVLLLLGIGFVVQQSPRFAYAGHTPFATPTGRAWLAVGLFALWLVGWGIAVLMRRLSSLRITWDAPPVAPPPAETHTKRAVALGLDRIDMLFRSARGLLRKDGPVWRLRRHSLYRLPWYLLLGAEGSGKTALLSSSRLRFSQHDGDACRPEDPCRFWLGDQAVLIEAAGSLALPGTDADAAYPLWRHLLKRLQQSRRRCPLDGVIVTISAADLLAGEPGLTAGARSLAQRLRDMQRCFGVLFPVYVVVTQCDRLAGFEAFFQRLDRAAADQVWGVTFPGTVPGSGDEPLTAFPAEFAALAQRLQNPVVRLLSSEADSGRAGRIYGFPAQFQALGDPLRAFLTEIFASSPYAPSSWLRGVYFTSAAQDGSRPARCASPLAAAIQAATPVVRHAVANAHGYFIARFFSHVVFQDGGLAGGRPRVARHRMVLRYVSPAIIVAAVVAAGFAFLAGYQRNVALIGETSAGTARLAALAGKPPAAGDPGSILAVLDAAAQPVPAAAPSGPSTLVQRHVGLYQGNVLAAAAHSTYQALLRQALLPFVRGRARQAMIDPTRGETGRFRALRTYLMLGAHEPGERSHYDGSAVLAWVAQDVATLPLNEAQRADMVAHARALFGSGHLDADANMDAALVARVRSDLAAQPLSLRLYEVLLGELRTDLPGTLSLGRLAGPTAPLVLRRASGLPLSDGVSDIYTVDGYRRYIDLRDKLVAKADSDRWVLGGVDRSPQGDGLRAELDTLYFSRYIDAWEALLHDVRMNTGSPEVRESAANMHLLASPDSPLRQFLQGVVTQTTLSDISGVGKAAGAAPAYGGGATTPVDRNFDALHQLFRVRAGSAPPFADVQAKLEELGLFLDAVGAARERGLPPPSPDAVTALQDTAESQPTPLGDMLGDLAANGRMVALNDVRHRVDELWRANVVPFCHAALDGRYPIDPNSSQDMAQDDFNRLLGPGGLIDVFFQTNLAPYVDMTTRPWRWRPNASKLRFSQAALQAFEDAAAIRQAFFPDGQKTMSIHFQLVPLSLDPYYTRFNLRLGADVLEYSHGPASRVTFQWPDTSATPSALIDYEPAGPDGRSGMAVSGPWALFRLLDKGTLQQVRADRFILTFNLSGKPVSLEMDANSVINPFALVALHRFRCVDRLEAVGEPRKAILAGKTSPTPAQAPAG